MATTQHRPHGAFAGPLFGTLDGKTEDTTPSVVVKTQHRPHGAFAGPVYGTLSGKGASSSPTAPTTVAGTATSGTTATLTWVDASSDETGFQVQIREAAGPGAWGDAAGATNPTAANVQTFSATGLTAATAYDVQVRAKGSSADSAYVQSASSFTTDNTGSGGGGIPTTYTATASLSAALQIARAASASVAAALQASRSATASLNAFLQSGNSTSASLSAAVRAQRAATASLAAALQRQRTAIASLNTYIFTPGGTRLASFAAALQKAQTLTASFSAYLRSGIAGLPDLYTISRAELAPKTSAATRSYTLDFLSQLPVGTTLSDALVDISVYWGLDAGAPALTSGALTISGTKVTFSLSSGLSGVIYAVTVAAIGDDDETYYLLGLVPVMDLQ